MEEAVPLREYFEQMLKLRDQLIDQRFEALAENLILARADHDRRFAELNKLREEVTLDRNLLVRNDIFNPFRELVNMRLTATETRAITWTTAIGAAFAALTLALHYFGK
jgi:hypothetical protein